MPKETKSKALRHDPLYVQMAEPTVEVSQKMRSKASKKQEKTDQDSQLLDAKTSRRILSMVKEQQDELEQENEENVNLNQKISR